MWWLLPIITFSLLYIYLYRYYTYWTRKGVKQGKPVFLFGDMWKMVSRQEALPDLTSMWYNIDPEARYVGVYQFFYRTLLLRDPELMKEITIKNYDNFLDRRAFLSEKTEPLFGKSILSLGGNKWKEMRATLSPSFTTNKIKFMFPYVTDCAKQLVEYYSQKEGMTNVEMRDVVSRFANDVIAHTISGNSCNSLKERNNDFYLMMNNATDFSSLRKLVLFFTYLAVPKIIEVLKLSFFPTNTASFFTNLLKENVASREQYNIERPDLVNLLLKSNKNSPNQGNEKSKELTKTYFTNDDITAQAFMFYFAGFDPLSTLLCYMAHELAVNPEVQEKLRREIDEVRENHEGDPSYEVIMTMKYMDMVVSETLRKWPNPTITERICTKPYTIQPTKPGEKPIHLKEKDIVLIPLYAVQNDPKYYPNPKVFDPERFNDENKRNIQSSTYIPFGIGPRVCIASRFALLETKTLFFHILSKLEIVPIEKTQIPIKFNKKAINMGAEKGFWLGFRPRE